jgi:putative molybdopterin biosynthesis protein
MTSQERNFYLENIPMADAQARLHEALGAVGKGDPLPGEWVELRAALGRITAETIWAKLSAPHYHASAMDGYAVRAVETVHATETQPIILLVPDQAIPLNTGDPLPPGMNAVIMIEQVQVLDNEGQISITAPVTPWQHIRMVGEDMVATELVLPANHKLRPVDLGAIAGCGHAQVSVRRKPHVVIIPTGTELVSAETKPATGQIIEYNSIVLGGQVENAGGTVTTLPITPDRVEALKEALKTALAQLPDLLLVLSGSSAGSKDFTASIIREAGQLLVHGVAVRPGHPVIMGMIQNTPVIGVPGYPVSAALTGELFIEPLIAAWLGQPSALAVRPQVTATSTRKLMSPIGDDDFVRVALAQVGDRMLATPLGRGAGVITSLVRADGLAHVPRFSEGVDVGREMQVILYRTTDEIQHTAITIGSHDPMLDLLAQFLSLHYPGDRLNSANVGSLGGLVALRRKEAHLTGIHLLDEDSGEYNIPFVRKQLTDIPVRVVTFAHREQGLIVAPGNPLGIKGIEDLTRIQYVNRQRGAGTRLLLDYELKQRDISPDSIKGYDSEEYTHLAVAVAVMTGVAECGMGVRSAAIALGLDFVGVGWERYDFVIPQEHLAHPVVAHLLSALSDPDFIQQLAAQPGYNVRETGKVQWESSI